MKRVIEVLNVYLMLATLYVYELKLEHHWFKEY